MWDFDTRATSSFVWALYQSTIDCVAYNQKKFTSHSSGVRDPEIRPLGRLSSGKSPLLGCKLPTSHHHTLTWKKERVLSGGSFSKDTDPIYESTTPHDLITAWRLHPLTSITLRVRIPKYEFERRGAQACQSFAHYFFPPLSPKFLIGCRIKLWLQLQYALGFDVQK